MQLKMIKRKGRSKTKRISSIKSLPSYIDIGEYKGEGIIEISTNNKKTLCCIMQISGIDIFNYSDYDKDQAYDNFAAATTSITVPYKFVFTDAHPVLQSQIEYLKYKESKNEHRFSKVYLQNQIKLLEEKERNQRDKLAFLMLFSPSQAALQQCAKSFMDSMRDTSVQYCEKERIHEFLSNYMCCNNTKTDKTSMLPSKAEIMQSALKTDDTYQTTIIIYDYPAILKNLEFASLISKIENVTFSLDVEHKPKAAVMRDLKFSLKELRSRRVLDQEVDEECDTELELQKLTVIRNEIANGAEQMLYTTLRITVSADSYKLLDKRVKEIRKELEDEGISSFVPINEMQSEYCLRLKPSNTVKTPMPLHDTYKMQYPFYYQSHLDPTGMYWGVSRTGGLVNIDFFTRNFLRPSYDILFVGEKGSGKSVALKSLVQDYLVLGNKILVLDIESEYADLARMYNGQIIRLNKSSLLNTLQMHKVIDSSREDEDFDVNSENAINFASEISRIISFFYQYIPGLTELEAEELKDIITATYNAKGIYDTTDVQTLKPCDFPIFSDVLNMIRKRLYKENGKFNDLTDRKIDTLEKLEIYVKNLAEGMYKSMFNGTSNINISDSNLIIFDVKALSQMDSRIYNAQLFNIVSLMWAETCKNVAYNNKIKHPFDRRYVISVIDEAHRFINANNIHVTEFINQECRRTRKYDAALWLASQSILDFNPTGNSEGAEKVRTIFSLIQYKIILKQKPESFDALQDSLKSFPKSELISTKDFIPGEMLISFGSDRNRIHCLRVINECALFYLGNSRDKEQIVHRLFDTYYHEKTREEYAELLKVQKQRFHNVFTEEILNYYGYKKDDSEHLYNIVYIAVDALISELMMLNQKNKAGV